MPNADLLELVRRQDKQILRLRSDLSDMVKGYTALADAIAEEGYEVACDLNNPLREKAGAYKLQYEALKEAITKEGYTVTGDLYMPLSGGPGLSTIQELKLSLKALSEDEVHWVREIEKGLEPVLVSPALSMAFQSVEQYYAELYRLTQELLHLEREEVRVSHGVY